MIFFIITQKSPDYNGFPLPDLKSSRLPLDRQAGMEGEITKP